MHFIVCISEFTAGKLYDFEGEVMTHSVDMMRKFLGICVHLTFRFCLFIVRGCLDSQERVTDRNNMYVEVALPTLLFAPLCDLRMTSRNEAKACGCIRGIGKLLRD